MSGDIELQWNLCQNSEYLVGSENQLAELQAEFPMAPDMHHHARFSRQWHELRRQLQVELGTLLKTDSVAVLLGAGASCDAGGLLLGAVPRDIETDMLNASAKVDSWRAAFYAAVATLTSSMSGVPTNRGEVEKRRSDPDAPDLKVNLELLLSNLESWERAFRDDETALRLAPDAYPELTRPMVREVRLQLISALVKRCDLSSPEDDPRAELLKKLTMRPLNLKRVGVFTLNYDRLIEHAADGEGIVLLDGFVGNAHRVFRPDSYDHDLYFPAETTEGRVHRLDRVLHLYKLHGSINWCRVNPSWHNPHGLEATSGTVTDTNRVVIYPTPAKYGESLLMPYAEMFRRLANTIVRPQATLIVIGYGFGDEHVNSIIQQALAVPSVNLIIVDPDPNNTFVEALKERDDRRIRIISGSSGRLSAFVHHFLPDLGEEEVTRKVVETYNALRPSTTFVDPETSVASQTGQGAGTSLSPDPDVPTVDESAYDEDDMPLTNPSSSDGGEPATQ